MKPFLHSLILVSLLNLANLPSADAALAGSCSTGTSAQNAISRFELAEPDSLLTDFAAMLASLQVFGTAFAVTATAIIASFIGE